MEERYSRQIILPEVGTGGQEKIASSKVLVIGAGGLGCPVIQYLSSAGVGTMGILDFDIVEESNLPRQPLFLKEDIGTFKAEVAAKFAKKRNSAIDIQVFSEELKAENADTIIHQYDLVIDCSDNFTTRYLVNDACIRQNKPWIFAAIEGWTGQLSVFNYNSGPSYRDLFPEAPESIEDCNTIGVIATLPAVMGSMQANEALKCMLGLDGILSGKLMILDLLNQNVNYFTIKNISKRENVSIELEWEAIDPHEFTIIDIRPEAEITNTLGYLQKAYYDITADDFQNGDKYLLVCESGKKSRIVAEKIRKQRPELQIFSLAGGIKGIR
jgi:adenylyltransferase/sulfurtransferase